MSVLFKIILSLFILSSSTLIYAGVTIQGTRIIFPAKSKAISVQLENQFSTPALVQVWLDNGDMNHMPKADEVPFILSPVISRVEAKRGQSIRIFPLNTETLAKDRESLFYFNMLDIPPEELKNDINYLSFNVRTRIKLFYRPEGLKIEQRKAFDKITVQYDATNNQLNINNPTPYFMNFSKFIINPNQQATPLTQALMVEPYSVGNLSVSKISQPIHELQYFLINDLGGEIRLNSVVENVSH